MLTQNKYIKFFNVRKKKLVMKEISEAYLQCHCPDSIIFSASEKYF
jgi:hypothetical protein